MTLVWTPGFTQWDPASITTALWLDAADASTVTTVSGAVSQWSDKSGNARNFTQSTAGNRPAYTASALNGRSAVTPDGGDDWLTGPVVFSGTTPNDYFVIAAVRMLNLINAGNNTGNALFYQQPEQTEVQIGLNLANGPNSFAATTDSFPPSGGTLIAASATQANTSYLFATSRTSGTRAIWINSAISASQSGAESYTGNAVTKTNLFGLNVTSGGGVVFYNALNAHVGEIVMLPYPTDATRQKLEGYLAHKWGLTANLPNSHPYRWTPPTLGE